MQLACFPSGQPGSLPAESSAAQCCKRLTAPSIFKFTNFDIRTAFLSGISIYSVNIYLPQRFQLANGLSPVDAGVRMLVLLVVSSVATGLGASICVVINIVYPILVVGFMLQILGLGLMSSLPVDEAVLARQYGYQTILGFGFGLSLSAIPVITRLELSHLDHGK